MTKQIPFLAELREELLDRADTPFVPQIGRPKPRRTFVIAVASFLGTLLLGSVAWLIASMGSEPATFPEEPLPGDEITFEQYETAYTGVVECLRNAGYTVEGPLQFGRDANAPLPLFVGIDPTIYLQRLVVGDVEAGALNAADAKCEETHLGDIEQRWLEQWSSKFVSGREWIDNLLACAEISGIEIPETLSYDEMLNDVGTDPSDDMIMEIASEAIVEHGCRPWAG